MVNKSNTEHTHRPRLRHAHHHAGAHEHGPEAYGQQAPKTSTPVTPDAPTARAGRQWWNEHAYLTVVLAIVAALALIAVFTPTGETSATIAPLAPTATATARDVVRPPVRATATNTARPTSTPRATPCAAPTLPYCELPPTEQARPVDLAPTGPTFTPERSSIGGTLVPDGLRCMEDEVIGYLANDVLGCVHVEGNIIEGGTY